MGRLFVIALLAIAGCGESKPKQCSRLFDHLMVLQLRDLAGDDIADEMAKEIEPTPRGPKNLPVVRHCEDNMTSDQIACALKAKTIDDVAKCDPDVVRALDFFMPPP